MSKFKVGDKVWRLCRWSRIAPQGLSSWDIPYDGYGDPAVITYIGPVEVGGADMICFHLPKEATDDHHPKYCFHTKREALAEAIRQNEGLASALTLEIARLKEELASCKD